MKKVGLGLIGCGGRLRGVLWCLKQATDQVEVVAACDPNPASIRDLRKEAGCAPTVYSDYRDLCRDPRVDWVMIGSWNCQHRDHAVAAFKAGKHVFCEKPLATSMADCLAMRDAWKASGRQFTIGFTLRYSPHYVRIRELLDQGLIGDLISMEFNETLSFNHGGYILGNWRRFRENAGTHLLEKCCHDVDLVNWFVGSPAVRTASFGGLSFFVPRNRRHERRIGKGPKGETAYRSWPGYDMVDPFASAKTILDHQVAILEFANGVRSTFHTNCNCGIPERRMYLCGTEGTLRADVISGKIEVARIGWDYATEDLSSTAKGGHGGGDMILGQSLAATMLDHAAPRTTLEDGLRSAITCFGIDKAQDTGRVVDLRPMWRKAGISF